MIRKIKLQNWTKLVVSRTNINYALIILSIILGTYLNWETLNILFFAFIIWLILYPLSSKILAKVSIALIVLLPIMILIRRTAMSDKFAMLFYAFLVLTAVTQVYEWNKKAGGRK